MIRQIWEKIQQNLKKQTANSSDWVTVFSSHNVYFSSIYKLALQDNGIPFKTIDHLDTAYNLFGEILFQVSPENVIEAQKILNSLNE